VGRRTWIAGFGLLGLDSLGLNRGSVGHYVVCLLLLQVLRIRISRYKYFLS
jgi:hypothetical protein